MYTWFGNAQKIRYKVPPVSDPTDIVHGDPLLQLTDAFLCALMTNEASTPVSVTSSNAAHVAEDVPVVPDNVIVTVIWFCVDTGFVGPEMIWSSVCTTRTWLMAADAEHHTRYEVPAVRSPTVTGDGTPRVTTVVVFNVEDWITSNVGVDKVRRAAHVTVVEPVPDSVTPTVTELDVADVKVGILVNCSNKDENDEPTERAVLDAQNTR